MLSAVTLSRVSSAPASTRGDAVGASTKTVLTFVGEQCGRARDATQLYQSALSSVVTANETDLGRNESRIEFAIDGASFVEFDSDGPHDFTFTPATPIWVDPPDADELTRVASSLSEDGRVQTPIGDYGFSPVLTWIDDRFGVS